MGVKRLYQIVKYFARDCIKEKSFKDYRGTTQALDASIIIYKFCIAILNTEHYRKPDGEVVGHLFACFFKSLAMLRYGIMPLWVFDGTPPTIKQDTINDRKKAKKVAYTKLAYSENLNENEKNKLEKKTFSVSTKQINEIKLLLGYLGLNYVDSPGEAEAQCAALNIANVCDGVVTEDWDVVLFGCKKMLKDFSNKSTVVEIDVCKLMDELGVNQEQLIDLCSILGNDYCNGIGGLKPIDVFNKFKKSNYIMKEFLELLRNENKNKFRYRIPAKFEEDWMISREYYLHAPVFKPEIVEVTWKEPQYEKLFQYLVNEKNFKRDIIRTKINELKLMYKYYISNNSNLITLSRINRDLEYNRRSQQRVNFRNNSRLHIKSG
jgi:flap endonuclease-1